MESEHWTETNADADVELYAFHLMLQPIDAR